MPHQYPAAAADAPDLRRPRATAAAHQGREDPGGGPEPLGGHGTQIRPAEWPQGEADGHWALKNLWRSSNIIEFRVV